MSILPNSKQKVKGYFALKIFSSKIYFLPIGKKVLTWVLLYGKIHPSR